MNNVKYSFSFIFVKAAFNPVTSLAPPCPAVLFWHHLGILKFCVVRRRLWYGEDFSLEEGTFVLECASKHWEVYLSWALLGVYLPWCVLPACQGCKFKLTPSVLQGLTSEMF